MAKYVSPFTGAFGRGGTAGSGGAKGYVSPFAEAFGGTSGQKHRKEVDAITPREEAAAAAKKQPDKKDSGNLAEKIGRLFLTNTAKAINTGAEGVRDTGELARGLLGAATHNAAAENAAVKRASTDRFLQKGSGFLGVGGLASGKEFEDMSAGGVTKKIIGGGLGVGSEVLPVGRGLGIASKGGKIGTAMLRGAGEGVLLGGAGSAGSQLIDKGNVDLKEALKAGGLGGVLGGLGTGAGRLAGRGVGAATSKLRGDTEAAIPKNQKLLPAVTKTKQDALAGRLDEINGRLDEIQNKSATTTADNPKNLDNLGTDRLSTGAPTTKGGAVDMRTGAAKRQGTVALSDTTTTGVGKEARALMAEKKAITSELNGLDSLPKEQQTALKIDIKNPKHLGAVKNELDNVERSIETGPKKQTAAGAAAATGDVVSGKINVLRDYVGVGMKDALNKIGLKNTSRLVEHSFENMRKANNATKSELNGWQRSLKGNKDASQRIFDHLDGDKSVKLSAAEQKVADAMKKNFAEAGDKLGIPKEGRVSNYITHLFDKDFKAKKAGDNYDPIANSILERRATEDVNNPFLKKRTGSDEYKHDAFAAYQAYMQKANRQIHMSDAVKAVAGHSQQGGIDRFTADYLAKASQQLSGRQRQQAIDRFADRIVHDVTFGKVDRGATRGLRTTRNMIYRGTMGMNIGSAAQNLTQAANTFGELGTRDTLAGYSAIARAFKDAAEQKAAGHPVTAFDEMFEHDVFGDNIRGEQVDLDAAKKFFQKVDKGMWAMFDTTERINRGAAYLGAKNQALRKGLSEEQAIKKALDTVKKTQFKFNEIETPIALQSEVAKTLFQFQSFSLRQTGYLGGIAKGVVQGNPKDIARAVRWLSANALIYGSLGQLMGMDWKNSIPLLSFRGVTNPTVQIGKDIYDVAAGKDKYGNQTDRGTVLKSSARDVAGLLIPGGTQARKTIEGVQTVRQGESKTAAGLTRFTVKQTPGEMAQAAAFGQYALPESRAHFANGNTQSYTKHQSEVLDNVDPKKVPMYQDFFSTEKGISKDQDKARQDFKKLVDDGQPGKAERKANEWNDQVDKRFSQFFRDHPNASDDLLEAYTKYKINITKRSMTPAKPKDKSKY